MIIGLTGGIGSGKSTAVKIFKTMGAVIIDADIIAKEITSYENVKTELEKRFPEAFIDGNMDRKKMREIIFDSKKNIEKLNEITHPAIIEKILGEIERNKNERLVIADIPLLFEVGMEKKIENILTISCDEEKQIDRIIKRDNSTAETAKKIIKSQMPIAEKEKKSRWVIFNNGTEEELREKIELFLANLKI